MKAHLPPGVSLERLGEAVGSQGRPKGTESLPQPKTVEDIIKRVGLLLAKEVVDYMSKYEDKAV